jgi:hypothetical protein
MAGSHFGKIRVKYLWVRKAHGPQRANYNLGHIRANMLVIVCNFHLNLIVVGEARAHITLD